MPGQDDVYCIVRSCQALLAKLRKGLECPILFDERYRLVREELGARKTFFDDVRALTRYICFDSWHHLLETMMAGLEIPIPPS